MDAKKFAVAVSMLWVATTLAACGKDQSSDTGGNGPSYQSACTIITAEEISSLTEIAELTGAQFHLDTDEPFDVVIKDPNTGEPLTPDPGAGRRCVFDTRTGSPTERTLMPGVSIILRIQLDPTEYFYSHGVEPIGPRRAVPEGAITAPVEGLGDKAFVSRYEDVRASTADIRYTARWGVWTVWIVGFSHATRLPDEDSLAEVLRTFISRLPKDHQQQ